MRSLNKSDKLKLNSHDSFRISSSQGGNEEYTAHSCLSGGNYDASQLYKKAIFKPVYKYVFPDTQKVLNKSLLNKGIEEQTLHRDRIQNAKPCIETYLVLGHTVKLK